MAAIAEAVTGRDEPDAWSVELEPASRPAGRRRAGGTSERRPAARCRRRSGRPATACRRGGGAVEALLDELGGRRPAAAELEAEVRALLDDPALGALLVAEAGARSSACSAPAGSARSTSPAATRRSRTSGSTPSGAAAGSAPSWSTALAALAREQGVARLEVGLPRESFAAIEQTEAFYRGDGFEHLGPRMRRLLR